MYRNKLMKLFVILLPVLSVGLATTTDSLMVFDTVSGVTSYYSYFQQVPGVPMALLAALAGILCIPVFFLAVVSAVKDLVWAWKGVKWISFVSACCAVTPILLRGEILVVPNVTLPLLMMTEFVLAYYAVKKKEGPAAKHVARLG